MISKIKVSLENDLRKKYGVRAFPIATGDIVRVKSGKRRGEGGKVVEVNHATGRVSIEGITIAKEDGKQTELYLRPEDLTITKLDFSREERIQKLRDIAAIKKITFQEPEPEEIAPTEPETVDAEATEVEETDTLEEAEADETTEDESEEAEEKSESEEVDDQ